MLSGHVSRLVMRLSALLALYRNDSDAWVASDLALKIMSICIPNNVKLRICGLVAFRTNY